MCICLLPLIPKYCGLCQHSSIILSKHRTNFHQQMFLQSIIIFHHFSLSLQNFYFNFFFLTLILLLFDKSVMKWQV